MHPIEVSHHRPSPPKVVALTWEWVFLGRMCPLKLLPRYGQGGYLDCESTILRAFWFLLLFQHDRLNAFCTQRTAMFLKYLCAFLTRHLIVTAQGT